MKLLHIDTSIQGASSVSRTISAAVVEQLKSEQPGLQVVHRDLAAEPVAHLTWDAFTAAQPNEVLAEFLGADVVVIGVALYNFTISSQLKAWIDRILVAGHTFRYTEAGPEGLAGGKRVIVALSRGNVYSEGSPAAPYEHCETLLRTYLGFIGIHDAKFIIAEGVAFGEDARKASIDAALAQVRALSLEPAFA